MVDRDAHGHSGVIHINNPNNLAHVAIGRSNGNLGSGPSIGALELEA